MYKMNYFDILPDDLQNEVFTIRNNNSVNTIINAWYQYVGKKIVAAQLLLDNIIGARYVRPYINIFNNHTSIILDYCYKVLTGRESDWWLKQFNIIEAFTTEHNYYGLGNDAEYYNKIVMTLDKLKQKFNL